MELVVLLFIFFTVSISFKDKVSSDILVYIILSPLYFFIIKEFKGELRIIFISLLVLVQIMYSSKKEDKA